MNRFLWLMLLLLLAGTAVGAHWAYNNGALGFAKQDSKGKLPVDIGPPPMVVALGLVDGETTVAKPLPLVQGRIIELAPEGTRVKKGATLMKLDGGMYQASVDEAKAALDDAQQRYEQVKGLPAQQQSKQLQQQDAIDAAEAEKKAIKLERDYKLERAKIEGGVQVNKLLLESFEEKLKQLDSKVKAEKEKLNELKLYKPQLDINRAKADVDAKDAQLKKAEWALKQCTLEAPSDGLLLRVTVSVGETLIAGLPGQTPPIQFLPDGKKIVRAEVFQEWAALIKVGQDVDIEDDTFQGQVWKGKVKTISNWFAPKRNRIIEPFMLNDVSTLETMVEVIDDAPTLRIGQRIRVKIKTN